MAHSQRRTSEETFGFQREYSEGEAPRRIRVYEFRSPPVATLEQIDVTRQKAAREKLLESLRPVERPPARRRTTVILPSTLPAGRRRYWSTLGAD